MIREYLSMKEVLLSHIIPVVINLSLARSKHLPEVEWFKDGLKLDSPDFQTVTEPDQASLTIDESFVDDSATYSCRVSNIAGHADCSAELKVKEVHKTIDQPPFFIKFV